MNVSAVRQRREGRRGRRFTLRGLLAETGFQTRKVKG